jgi:tripartite-type tricarboxylate transporter receptor subunit TctC
MLKIASVLVSVALIVVPRAVDAAVADQDFYRGKTIRFVVGFAAGGGFDAYARIIARHMSRHISGNPSIIVENMTGAGSRVAANFLFKAQPDGLVVGILSARSYSSKSWVTRALNSTGAASNGSVRRCKTRAFAR